MEEWLSYIYPLSQIIIFMLYYPLIQRVLKSESAAAINVPAQFAFFLIGAIAAMYMMVVNEDFLASLIICGHILIGNLTVGVIALCKQRRARDRR